MTSGISFGTSGWRGIIARDFTWDRVHMVIDAIALYLLENGRDSVIVGGDTRFLSPELARDAAERFASYGFRALLSDRPVPTPVLSNAVRRLEMGGVVNFTASHNPFMYNGVKFSPGHGGPAQGKVTDRIEEIIETGAVPPGGDGTVETADIIPPYLNDLKCLIDCGAIARGAPRVVYDAFNGTGSGILDSFLQASGASVRTIHEKRDPLFDGRHPEPNEKGLSDLSVEVKRSGAGLGVATDGDADRFGIVDENGFFVSPHDYLALLLEYLVLERGYRGACVRSVTTGSLMDRVAAAHGLETIETPVGFKYLGGMMLEREVSLAGEESGGLSVGGHVPEKDGILACLFACEMCAVRGAGLAVQLDSLWNRYGRLWHRRLDLKLTPGASSGIRAAFFDHTPPEVSGSRVESTDSIDGMRFRLSGGSSILVRLSGTEPLARIYLEAGSPDMLDSLETGVRAMIPLD